MQDPNACSKGADCSCKPPASADAAGGVDRRKFLTGTAAAAVAGGAAAQGPQDPVRSDLFLKEEHWKERMQAPDDGKKFGWVVDVRRCFGCHGCEVSCKAENDVPLGSYIRQTIYHDYEKQQGGLARIMVPMACQHREDAPCIKACLCGAMHKGAGGSVQVDYDHAQDTAPAVTPALRRDLHRPRRQPSDQVPQLHAPRRRRHGPRVRVDLPERGALLRRPQRPRVLGQQDESEA